MNERSIRIRGIDSARALDALREVERRIATRQPDLARRSGLGSRPGSSNGTAEPRRYHRYREWLIQNRLLRRLLAGSVGPPTSFLPGLGMPEPVIPRVRRTLRLAGSIVDPRQSVVLAARADAIFGNSNLRGFYLSAGEPVTVKAAVRPPEASFYEPLPEIRRMKGALVALDVPRQAAWLHREVVAREYAGRFLDVPDLLGYEFTGPYPYLVESVVGGRRPSPSHTAEVIGDLLLPRLLSMYEDYGYRYSTPAELLGGEDVLVEMEAALDFIDTESSAKRRLLAAARDLLGTPRRVAISFTHGDLAPNNISVTKEGDVFLLDWEQAGENLVARDFRALLSRVPERNRRFAAAAMRSQSDSAPPDGLCSLHEQLGVLGIRDLAAWRRLKEQCEWGRNLGDVKRRLESRRDLVERMAMERGDARLLVSAGGSS